MKRDNKIDRAFILESLVYDKDNGSLVWKKRPRSHFKTLSAYKRWNSIYEGKEAGSIQKNCRTSYRIVELGGSALAAHRIIWFMVYGYFPLGEVDHIDGNGLNNKIENIRDVSSAVNKKNKRLSVINSSGIYGVHWAKELLKWRVRIGDGGKRLELGVFDNLLDAASARKSAEIRLGYHANHGFNL